MERGSVEDLPAWVRPWLDRPAAAPQPVQNLRFEGAQIRSLDGGRTWTLLEGERAALPDYVQPWLDRPRPEGRPQAKRTAAVPEFAVDLFPNPARNSVTLRFELASAQMVSLSAYDLQGRLVRSWVAEWRPAGVQEWKLSLEGLSSGSFLLEVAREGGVSRHPLQRIQP